MPGCNMNETTTMPSNHSQVMGIGDVVDVASKTEGKFGHWNEERKAASCSRALDIHCGPARRLTDATADILTSFAKPLHQSHGCGSFTLSKRGRSNGRNLN